MFVAPAIAQPPAPLAPPSAPAAARGAAEARGLPAGAGAAASGFRPCAAAVVTGGFFAVVEARRRHRRQRRLHDVAAAGRGACARCAAGATVVAEPAEDSPSQDEVDLPPALRGGSLWSEFGVHPPLGSSALQLRRFPDRGLGWVATRDIEEGEALLAVPLKDILCAPMGPDSEAELAAALLQVLGEGPRFDGSPGKEPVDEIWSKYTGAAFPSAPAGAALTWNEADIEALEFPSVVGQLKAYRAHLLQSAEQVAAFTGAPLDRCTWAVNAVVTRSFGEDHLGRVLAPFADLFNDRPMAPAIWAAKRAMNPEYPVTAWTFAETDGEDGQKWFLMRSMAPVAVGQEVAICYGEGSHAEVHVFSSPAELVEAVANLSGRTHSMEPRLELLTNATNAAAPLAVRPGGLGASAHLLSCMEVALVDDVDLPSVREVWSIGAGHAVLQPGVPEDRRAALRKEVLELASQVVTQRLSELTPASADEDEIRDTEAKLAAGAESEDGEERLRRRHLAARFRLGAKGVLSQFLRRAAEDEPTF
ncbi:unnamed protein product [Prorocentrum cordatum]|uniref:SET domain-containing protein n=1 Tax=Prorocentrum cordatum TaxID=2364126 RepID=A0ABN9SNU8_9DINO|nr:unnamed protein product [Polarella glacialis]